MSNRIILTGGTGFLGSSLINDLVERGYNCVVFTRSPEKYKSTEAVKYIEWIPESSYLTKYISGSKAVINLAGAPIAGKRWTDEYKKLIIDSRVDTTNALVDAINRCKTKPEMLLSSSASGYFGDRDDEILTEDSNPIF